MVWSSFFNNLKLININKVHLLLDFLIQLNIILFTILCYKFKIESYKHYQITSNAIACVMRKYSGFPN